MSLIALYCIVFGNERDKREIFILTIQFFGVINKIILDETTAYI
jgi:hypothetical protein